MATENTTGLLTVAETAALLNCSLAFVYSLLGKNDRRQLPFPFSDNYLSPLNTWETLRGGGLAECREPERSDGDRSSARPPPRHHTVPSHRLAQAPPCFAFLAASAR